MPVRSTLFEYWRQKEIELGRRLTVAEVARATGSTCFVSISKCRMGRSRFCGMNAEETKNRGQSKAPGQVTRGFTLLLPTRIAPVNSGYRVFGSL
jgi:hypothetical protein